MKKTMLTFSLLAAAFNVSAYNKVECSIIEQDVPVIDAQFVHLSADAQAYSCSYRKLYWWDRVVPYKSFEIIRHPSPGNKFCEARKIFNETTRSCTAFKHVTNRSQLTEPALARKAELCSVIEIPASEKCPEV